jgi:glucose uptake protein
MAYSRIPGQRSRGGVKGLVLSVSCGVLMSMFYFLVARSIGKFDSAGGTLEAGKMSAYTANAVFALGILLSNFVLNTAIMVRPFAGEPVPLGAYFRGRPSDHLWGVLGGCIWGVGMGLNIAAAQVASPAVSYGLGQGATLVAAVWGVFIWREFREAPPGTGRLLALMFAGYVVGLGLVIAARVTFTQ